MGKGARTVGRVHTSGPTHVGGMRMGGWARTSGGTRTDMEGSHECEGTHKLGRRTRVGRVYTSFGGGGLGHKGKGASIGGGEGSGEKLGTIWEGKLGCIHAMGRARVERRIQARRCAHIDGRCIYFNYK
jgi:hypothetical protein